MTDNEIKIFFCGLGQKKIVVGKRTQAKHKVRLIGSGNTIRSNHANFVIGYKLENAKYLLLLGGEERLRH